MACTTSVQQDPLAIERQCAAASDALLARYSWRLLDREEFVRRAAGYLRAGTVPDAQRAAMHAYCWALHAACAGAEGSERRELAYAELFRYLYDSARRRYPLIAAEVAQDAIERVYLAFDRCRQPGAFLAFALQQLMDAARATDRVRARQATSLSTPVGADGGETLGDLLPDTRQPEPTAVVLAEERRARLDGLYAAFLRRHPRAADQLAALWLKHVEGLDDETIARLLGKSVSNVHVLRSRALATLRTEPEWHAFAQEYGIIEAPPHPVVAATDEWAAAPASGATARTGELVGLLQQGG
jgi:RNA polymerase sigma factor (sigma-70 family)